MKNVIFTKKIRINGLPLLNPFKSLEELKKWLEESLEAYKGIAWRVEEFQGALDLALLAPGPRHLVDKAGIVAQGKRHQGTDRFGRDLGDPGHDLVLGGRTDR